MRASELFDIAGLLGARAPRGGLTKLVGIDGHGGSGKSSLADLLAHRFDAQIVHTDDFGGEDNPKDWWPAVIELVLEPISVGASSISYPRASWWGQRREPVVDQPVTEVMILEGVGSLRREFRPYLSLGIFVATPRVVCIARGTARDAQRGTAAQVLEQWNQWFDDELGYVERHRPEELADLVVDGTTAFATQIVPGMP